LTYLDAQKAEKELARIAKKYAPDLVVDDIDIQDGLNQIGGEIVRVTIVYSRRTADDTDFAQQRFVIADAFHEWALKQGDVRFPHFSFRSRESDAFIRKEMMKNA
jgi:glutamine synthetase type III